MIKRVLLIIGFILVTLGIGFAIYYFFFRPTGAPLPQVVREEEAPTPPVGFPVAGERVPTEVPTVPEAFVGIEAARIADGGLTIAAALTPLSTKAPTLSPDGNGLRYYDNDSGKFFRSDIDTGERVQLSDKTFPNVETISWAPTEDKAILEFPDGSNILFDFIEQRQTTLPKHWEEFSFTANSDKIVGKSIGLDPSNRFLMMSNPDGSGATAIQELGNNADRVKVNISPTAQVVAFSRTGNPQGFGRQEILLIGQKHENFKSLIVEGFNFAGQWAPDGQRLLYNATSPSDGFRPALWIVEAAGNRIGANRRKLNMGTWSDKCVFASDTQIYCGVPRFLEQGVGLERSLADNVADDIFVIDLTTGSRKLVAQLDTNSTIENLLISPDGKVLTFTEKRTNILRQVRLTP